MIIPTVGVFHVRDRICAVAFDEGLSKDTFSITNNNYTANERKDEATKFLTLDRMDQFQLSQCGYDVDRKDYQGRFMSLDEDCYDYLKSGLGISTNNIFEGSNGQQNSRYRPLTASLNYGNLTLNNGSAVQGYGDLCPSGHWTNGGNNSRRNSGRHMMSNSKSQNNSMGHRPQSANPDFNWSQNIKNSLRLKSHTEKISEARLTSISKKRLGLWMRQTSIQPIDAFFEIQAKEFGSNVERRMKVNPQIFADCLVKMEIGIDQASADIMSRQLSGMNRDGTIDAMGFIDYMSSEERDPQNILKDIIYLNGLKFEDIMKTMDIPKESAKLDYFKLRDGLKRIDPSINRVKAEELAKQILGERDEISVYDLIEAIEGIGACSGHKEDIESNTKVIQKIRLALLEHDDPTILKQEFEKWDKKNEGLQDPANFKTCQLKLKSLLGVTIGEINRLGRYIEKTKEGVINYVKFLEKLDKEFIKATLVSTNSWTYENKFNLNKFAERINKYLKHENLTIRMQLRRMCGLSEELSEEELRYQRNPVSLPQFFNFVKDVMVNHPKEKEEKYISDEKLGHFCEKVDIDTDGMIDYQDLDTFLTRHNFIENNSKRLIDTVKSTYGYDFSKKMTNVFNGSTLYPTTPVDNSKIDMILRDLRNALLSRNTSYHEFFNKLDTDRDGLITYNEFESGVLSVVRFSKPIIKGLFAYFDRQRIGMIDFANFLKVMKKSVLDHMTEGQEDNFDWSYGIIDKIREWYKNLGNFVFF